MATCGDFLMATDKPALRFGVSIGTIVRIDPQRHRPVPEPRTTQWTRTSLKGSPPPIWTTTTEVVRFLHRFFMVSHRDRST